MSANTTHPVCKSCGKSTRTAKRPTYCASCADAPATRYRHDADHLRRLAGWLEERAEQPAPEARALDYYRLLP